MKIFLFFSLITITCIFGQNPDGTSISLHITPYFITGTVKNELLAHKYDDSFKTIGTDLKSSDSYNFDKSFGIQAILKIPLDSHLTLSPFIYSENLGYNYAIKDSYRSYYITSSNRLAYSNINVDNNNKFTDYRLKFGATISIYF